MSFWFCDGVPYEVEGRYCDVDNTDYNPYIVANENLNSDDARFDLNGIHSSHNAYDEGVDYSCNSNPNGNPSCTICTGTYAYDVTEKR